jgi:hypothetical protein
MGLVAVHVALHVVALSLILMHVQPSDSMTPFAVFLEAIFLLGPSQGVLVAMWVILGGGKFLWRALAATLGAAAYLWCFSNADEEWLTYLFGEVMVWCVLLLAARCTGLELSRATDVKPASRRFQFSIRDMFVWTTTVAVFLSAWYSARENGFVVKDHPDVGPILSIFTAIAGVCMFSALTRGWIVVRVVLLPIVVALAAESLVLCIGFREPFWYLFIDLSLMSFWLVASFLVLRFAGYRLAWRSRPEQPQADVPA